MKFSITIKLFLIFSTVSLAGVLIYGIIIQKIVEKRVIDETYSNLRWMVSEKKQYLEGVLRDRQNRMKDFSSDGFIRDSISQFDGSRAASLRLGDYLLQNKFPLLEDVHSIVITDLDGLIVASTHENEIGQNISQSSLFKKITSAGYGEALLGEIEVLNAEDQELVLPIAAPLYSRETTPALKGGIVAFLNKQTFDKAINPLNIKDFSAYFRDIEIGFFLSTTQGKLLSFFGYPESLIAQETVAADPIERCARKLSTSDEYLSFSGKEVFGVSECVNNGWVLGAEIKKADALMMLNFFQIMNISILAIMSMLISVLILIVSGYLVRPMKILIDNVSQFRAGGRYLPVKVKVNDEIGELTALMNDLMGELDSQRMDTEGKLSELEKMNKLMIGRELEMIRLKEELAKLKSRNDAK